MSELPVTVLAGMVSTGLFVVSCLPMLVKAFRTRDLTSYSLGNLVLANVGNGVHSVYVFSLPPGPIWFLHGFHLTSTALMLAWHRMYAAPRRAKAVADAVVATCQDDKLKSAAWCTPASTPSSM